MKPVESQTAAQPLGSHQCAQVWVALRAVYERVSAELAGALAKECGLTINEFEILLFLNEAGDRRLRLGDLGEAVQLSQPALSRLVMRLEQQGLIGRADADDDRRAVCISLTDRGAALLERATPIQREVVERLLSSQMTGDEQATLISVFQRMSGPGLERPG
jgi:DNA-binding MarR family transcriptional regulator